MGRPAPEHRCGPFGLFSVLFWSHDIFGRGFLHLCGLDLFIQGLRLFCAEFSFDLLHCPVRGRGHMLQVFEVPIAAVEFREAFVVIDDLLLFKAIPLTKFLCGLLRQDTILCQ